MRTQTYLIAAICAVILGGVTVLSAQIPAPSQSTPKFEVAAIKLNTTTKIPLSVGHLAFLREAGAGNAKNGRFWMQGDIAATPLTVLIQLAYNVRDLQVEGGPSLLAERFRLTLRPEIRQLPVYDLLPDRDGLKLAPMKPGECLSSDQAKPFGPLTCGGVRKQLGPERHVLEVVGIPMTKLIGLLSDEVGRVVVDKTGFTDLFSVRLEFAPVGRLQVAPSDSSPPSLFGALHEQLGLTLEPARGAVEVLVIESVERPTPD